MNEVKILKEKIERAREELNKLFLEQDFETYKEKSIELDKLIEEYIELDNQ